MAAQGGNANGGLPVAAPAVPAPAVPAPWNNPAILNYIQNNPFPTLQTLRDFGFGGKTNAQVTADLRAFGIFLDVLPAGQMEQAPVNNTLNSLPYYQYMLEAFNGFIIGADPLNPQVDPDYTSLKYPTHTTVNAPANNTGAIICILAAVRLLIFLQGLPLARTQAILAGSNGGQLRANEPLAPRLAAVNCILPSRWGQFGMMTPNGRVLCTVLTDITTVNANTFGAVAAAAAAAGATWRNRSSHLAHLHTNSVTRITQLISNINSEK
jgi:hypothetical protein